MVDIAAGIMCAQGTVVVDVNGVLTSAHLCLLNGYQTEEG